MVSIYFQLSGMLLTTLDIPRQLLKRGKSLAKFYHKFYSLCKLGENFLGHGENTLILHNVALSRQSSDSSIVKESFLHQI